jgi:hypothetical protein
MPSTNHGLAADSTGQPFTPNNVWSSTPASGVEEELTLPSGQTCRAKRMAIEDMLAAGFLTDVDALTAQVTKHTRKVKGAKAKPDGEEVNVASLMRDPKAVSDLITMVDRILPYIVVSPVIHLHYTETKVGNTTVTKKIPVEDREFGGAYTDQIGFEDKMWLFDWAAGGLGSMMKFRE